MDWKKVVLLAVVTFIEAAAGFYVANVALGSTSPLDKVVLAGAVGAGISAAYNVVRYQLGR